MTKVIKFLKKEFLELLPALIFFFVAFHLIGITESLMLRQYNVSVSTTALITVSAFVISKAMLIADHLPLINRFPTKPLIYNITWKTFIYFLISLFFSYLEALIPLLFKHQSLSVARQHLRDEIVWPHFWAIQIWVVVLILGYTIIKELIRIIGKKQFLKMFFGG